MSFLRAYNSLDTRVGPMGASWTHNYAVRVRSPDDGSLDLVLEAELVGAPLAGDHLDVGFVLRARIGRQRRLRSKQPLSGM